MGILEKISDIEREIGRTQKNKATEHHLGMLKGKLAKLRAELLEPKTTSVKGEGFDVMKSGDARVSLIGFPSVGKSTLLGKFTETHSEAASYEFTTLTCIPGKMLYHGANIQILDLPGIIQGASEGKGRGRQVIAVARTSDLVVMMLDATKSYEQKRLLEKELEAVGIRLNKRKPNIYFKLKKGGGVTYNSLVKQPELTEKFARDLLHQYKIFNAEVIVREEVTTDDFIDVIVGNRKYLPCLYVYNKIDAISIEEIDRIARKEHSIVVSIEQDLNTDRLKDKIWEYLNLLRVYTKRHGEYPDFNEGLIIRDGATVEHACHTIHRSLAEQFRYALVWGKSAKHTPQRVGLSHVLNNEDVVQIVKK
ncbi:Ribosome-interacting GTPase 2 [Mycoemilia scoparia]|uniref:Ribosome-interacting GTPase 2 n=1 Tax=Mycoemilia scoparia TaxID=417184 RepID=A0A9W7ZY39_9FUNG|nr:Ribosome-interacting GTPase 2 [Mycoemilia scoparia]